MAAGDRLFNVKRFPCIEGENHLPSKLGIVGTIPPKLTAPRAGLKASVFMGLLGPDPRAMESPFGTISPEKLKDRDIFPRRDYAQSALRMRGPT
jgi:hypothetical protein